ncbi:MAG: hypothetical protein R3A13_12720 [Bdellovibrionota bacterium]
MAILLIDCHVHIYPCFDLKTLISSAHKSFDSYKPQGSIEVTEPETMQKVYKVLCLTERSDCNFFKEIQSPDYLKELTEYKFQWHAEQNLLEIIDSRAESLFILPGRQIVSKEKIELLGLNMSEIIPNGLSAEVTIREIMAVGGLPVINWAPGKWLFKRGRIIRRLLEIFPSELALGDTTLRPQLFPEPSLMRRHRLEGKPVIRGSDSLPIVGEEKLVGSYGILGLIEKPFDV